jgi:hypothetical protein
MTSQYIPAGRTSMVKKGKSEFQLQTEYAAIPQPRVTTTIFSQGQVLYKVEKNIGGPIDSIEEMHRIEEIIKSQHSEISKTLRERGIPPIHSSITGDESEAGLLKQLKQIEEVEGAFLISPEGKIADDRQITREFKKSFKHVFKELPHFINVFASLPGNGNRREEGIFEIEPGKIILVSTGIDFYLIFIRAGSAGAAVKDKLRRIFIA